MEDYQAVEKLAALAHEGRLAIFRHLVQATEAVAAGEIGQALKMPNSTLSFHLKNLQQSGLIHANQEGRFIYYSPARADFQALLGYLTQNCCGGAGCPAGISH
jgi:DNA-binding transcriptional ArsR family regulator